jgi:uncharacterized membrane protein
MVEDGVLCEGSLIFSGKRYLRFYFVLDLSFIFWYLTLFPSLFLILGHSFPVCYERGFSNYQEVLIIISL